MSEVVGAFLRVLKVGSEMLPHGHTLPEWQAFNPSTDERADPPIRVSVFLRDRTSVDQALAITNKPNPRVFEVTSDAIRRVNSAFGAEMSVVEHPIDPKKPIAAMPGAKGHCGILQCDRGTRELKLTWKDRLAALARECRHVPE